MVSGHCRNLIAGLVLACAGNVGSAHAVPVTFDFTGGAGQQSSYFNFSSSGLSLKVSSSLWNDTGTTVSNTGKVGRWSTGLGVLSGASNDEHFVDGKDKNELLSLSFSQAVKMVSVTFSYNDSDDDFAFFFDKNANGNLAGDLVWKKKDIPGSSFYGTYTFAALESMNAIGKLFGIGAFESNDNFKVASITVNNAPSAVPLPGALPLLISALGAMGWSARRRFAKKTQA